MVWPRVSASKFDFISSGYALDGQLPLLRILVFYVFGIGIESPDRDWQCTQLG